MTENINEKDMINININNSDSNASGGSPSLLDRLFDIGLKLIIPLGLLLALIAIVIIVQVVLPLVGVATDLLNSDLFDASTPLGGLLNPLGFFIATAGTLFGMITGRD